LFNTPRGDNCFYKIKARFWGGHEWTYGAKPDWKTTTSSVYRMQEQPDETIDCGKIEDVPKFACIIL